VLGLTVLSCLALATPIQGSSAGGIQTWAEPSSAEGWAAVAVAIDRAGETDLEVLDELVSRLAGYGADVLAARGGQTRAYLLEDTLVVVDSVPAADLNRALNFASARLMRPLETTRVPVERHPLPRAARARGAGVSLEELRARLLVRDRVVVAAVAPGDGARLAAQVSRGVRARLPSGQANHKRAFEAHAVPGPGGPIYVRPKDKNAAHLAVDRIVAEALGGELRVGSDRVVLMPGIEPARDANSARDRTRASLERTAAHPADRAMALARLGLAVDGGLPAIQATLESGAVELADLAASAARFGFELPELPSLELPKGEKLRAKAPVVAASPRPGSPWAARAIAIPAKPGTRGLRALARVLTDDARYERGYVRSLIQRGGSLSARARPEGLVLVVDGPARLDVLIANAAREVLAGPRDLKGEPRSEVARRGAHTAGFWSTAFGRVPRIARGDAEAAWAQLDFKRAAIFVDGEAKTERAPRWPAAQPWAAPAKPRAAESPRALVASQVVPFAPRVLAEGEAMAGVLEARVRRHYPRAEVRFESTRGAALLGVRVPLDAPDQAAAALTKAREIFGGGRSVTRAELRAAFAAVGAARAARRARVGDGAADLAAHYLVTGHVNGRAPDEQNLARLLWVVPEPRALRPLSVVAADAPGGSG
jgi:hypothetical protein